MYFVGKTLRRVVSFTRKKKPTTLDIEDHEDLKQPEESQVTDKQTAKSEKEEVGSKEDEKIESETIVAPVSDDDVPKEEAVQRAEKLNALGYVQMCTVALDHVHTLALCYGKERHTAILAMEGAYMQNGGSPEEATSKRRTLLHSLDTLIVPRDVSESKCGRAWIRLSLDYRRVQLCNATLDQLKEQEPLSLAKWIKQMCPFERTYRINADLICDKNPDAEGIWISGYSKQATFEIRNVGNTSINNIYTEQSEHFEVQPNHFSIGINEDVKLTIVPKTKRGATFQGRMLLRYGDIKRSVRVSIGKDPQGQNTQQPEYNGLMQPMDVEDASQATAKTAYLGKGKFAGAPKENTSMMQKEKEANMARVVKSNDEDTKGPMTATTAHIGNNFAGNLRKNVSQMSAEKEANKGRTATSDSDDDRGPAIAMTAHIGANKFAGAFKENASQTEGEKAAISKGGGTAPARTANNGGQNFTGAQKENASQMEAEKKGKLQKSGKNEDDKGPAKAKTANFGAGNDKRATATTKHMGTNKLSGACKEKLAQMEGEKAGIKAKGAISKGGGTAPARTANNGGKNFTGAQKENASQMEAEKNGKLEKSGENEDDKGPAKAMTANFGAGKKFHIEQKGKKSAEKSGDVPAKTEYLPGKKVFTANMKSSESIMKKEKSGEKAKSAEGKAVKSAKKNKSVKGKAAPKSSDEKL